MYWLKWTIWRNEGCGSSTDKNLTLLSPPGKKKRELEKKVEMKERKEVRKIKNEEKL